MTAHATLEPEARAAHDAQLAARRAVLISLIGAGLAAGTVLWGIVLGVRNGSYLLAIWGSVILVGMLIGTGFCWAGRPRLGISIVVTTLLSLLIVASLIASGRGFITATIAVIIGGGIAVGTLPRRLAGRFVIISVACGLLSFALDVFGSPDRIAPEVDPIWGTIVAMGALLLYGILLIRRFAGFSLGERLLVAAGLVVTVVLAGLLLWTAQRQETQIIAQVDQQARILFQQIVLTRAWIAAQPNGGVYSKVEGAVEPNSYLLQVPGLEVNLETTSGMTYTLRNPALVTRELSELAAKQGLYQFHITSLRPFNPDNQPTDWERTALESFERNETSAALMEKTDQGQVYRYMAPLRVTEACLRCHAQQGYQVGEVRGGISVMIPMSSALTAIRTNNQQLLLVGVTAVAMMLLVIGVFVRGQVSTPLGKLRQAATALAQGDLTQEVNIQSHDELGQVAAAFNSMTRQLRDTIGSLELRVQARTAQLDTSAEVGRAAASILDPEQLLSEVVNLITNRFGHYYAAVFTLDATGQV
ncbi:MAG: DUF3365 domain-containing protein, partial [Thermoflexales bacterium]|nr:DUF3365 domain-containing protein [Thermoflexales bacterium]